MIVYVKKVLAGNGRFRLTLDPNVTPEKVETQKKQVMHQLSKRKKRKNIADLEVGKEMLGTVVKVSCWPFRTTLMRRLCALCSDLTCRNETEHAPPVE